MKASDLHLKIIHEIKRMIDFSLGIFKEESMWLKTNLLIVPVDGNRSRNESRIH